MVFHFDRQGKKWVRFQVECDDGSNDIFEREVIRITVIIERTGSEVSRPKIKLPICVGRIWETVEVNLTDRSYYSQMSL